MMRRITALCLCTLAGGCSAPKLAPQALWASSEQRTCCLSLGPATGMHCIGNAVSWHKGWTNEPSPRRFWRAYVPTTTRIPDGTTVSMIMTLIAGQWEHASYPDQESSGILPPLDDAHHPYDRAIKICTADGTSSSCSPGIVEVHNGFLIVSVRPVTYAEQQTSERPQLPPYPLIVRNRAIAGGAQQTTFVVMGVMDGAHEVHQRVYRPNQAAVEALPPVCSQAAGTDATSKLVATEAVGGGGLAAVQQTGYMELSFGTPATLDAADVAFVQEACEFLHAVLSENGLLQAHSWTCTPERVQDTSQPGRR